MRLVNPDHVRTADYAVFDEQPSTVKNDGVIYSYAMEHDGRFARLDI